MDRCGGSDRSGIASLRRTSAMDICAPGPASEFGPRLLKQPEQPTRREQKCRQRDNISVSLHEQLRRGHGAQISCSALESKIRALKIDKSRIPTRASKNSWRDIGGLSTLRQFACAVSLLASAVSAPARSSCAVRRRRARAAQARRSDRLSEPRSSRRVSNRSDRPTPSAV